MARMRGTWRVTSSAGTACLLDFENATTRISEAAVPLYGDSPGFGGFGQFRFHMLPLMEQRDRPICEERLSKFQKLGEGCNGAGGDHAGENLGCISVLDARRIDMDRSASLPSGFAQERRLLVVRLEEVDLDWTRNGEDESR